ncbi:MAG: hypothetical protein LBF37_03100 [Rickettsiales bacterium]|nr:hypothetical protein [Rickettsiales bacterium]
MNASAFSRIYDPEKDSAAEAAAQNDNSWFSPFVGGSVGVLLPNAGLSTGARFGHFRNYYNAGFTAFYDFMINKDAYGVTFDSYFLRGTQAGTRLDWMLSIGMGKIVDSDHKSVDAAVFNVGTIGQITQSVSVYFRLYNYIPIESGGKYTIGLDILGLRVSF